jgi:EmrB/QacA subfamily drug resistance transporter
VFSIAQPADRTDLNPKAKFLVLLTTSLVSSLIMLDSNIVAVSLPAIGRSLHASFTDIEWVVSAYLLSYAALLLAAGAYADLRGRKKAMLAGLVIFAVASGACGLATSSLVLNLARAVQGIGGALLLTAALAVITHTFSGTERAHAFAVWGACLGIALTAGPILGGAITKFFGWRWVFLVNVPACALLIFATLAVIVESRDADAKRLDLPGILTFSPGLFLLIWALIDGNDLGWGSTPILLRLAGAGVCLAAFGFFELRQERPMVDFALFRQPTFLGAVFAMVGYGAAAQVMVFYLPLFLQNAYGFEPAKAGLAMTPFALPMVLAPRFTSKLATRLSGRALLTTGLAITFLGNLLFWWIARGHLSYSVFVVGMLVAGTGAGVLNGETVKVLGGAVPPQRAGMASGIASTTRFIGILFGVAGLGAVLSAVTRSAFTLVAMRAGLGTSAAKLAARHVTSGDTEGMLNVVPHALHEQLHSAALAAFANGFASAALLAATAAGIACALTFWLVRSVETAPLEEQRHNNVACKAIDCRNPI